MTVAVLPRAQAGLMLPRILQLTTFLKLRHSTKPLILLQVSLTSSIDRECGISLYMVLFAVLLNQRKHHATCDQGSSRSDGSRIEAMRVAIARDHVCLH